MHCKPELRQAGDWRLCAIHIDCCPGPEATQDSPTPRIYKLSVPCLCVHTSARAHLRSLQSQADEALLVSQGRDHLEFVCRLCDYVPAREHVLERTADALRAAGFAVREASLEQASVALEKDYLRSTRTLPPS